MGKKRRVNYRAEQNRKRNLEQAEIRRKQAKNKAIWDAHGKQIIIASVAVILALILIWLGCKWFRGPGGSLPNFFGNLRTVESDWIVTNTGSSSKPTYFKLGEMTNPEGYTLDPDFSATTNSKNQTFFYTNDDETAADKSVYVAGVANKDAASMLETVTSYGYFYDSGEIKSANIAGHDVQYCYFVYGDSETATTATDADGNEVTEYVKGYGSLTMYIDSVEDSCVLLLVNGHVADLAEVATEEELLAATEAVLPNLTVEK